MNKIYDSGAPLSLMFQTGYMTIADWRRHSARLRVPNQEVMEALSRDLIPAYMGRDEVEEVSVNRLLQKLEVSLLDGDVETRQTCL